MKTRNAAPWPKTIGAILFFAQLIGACGQSKAVPDATSMASQVPLDAVFCARSAPHTTQCAQPFQLPPGFVPYKNIGPTPGEGAFSAPGAGGICCGQLAVVDRGQVDITVSRAWSPNYQDRASAPPNYYGAYQYGGYWSVGTLPKSKATYRAEANVCEEYNSLATFSVCKIKPGTVVAIGRGQSATCKVGRSYPQSASLQVMIVGNPENAVWQCSTYTWPSAGSGAK